MAWQACVAASVFLVGGCGASDEHGGRDTTSPRAVDSEPREGQVAVAHDLGRVTVRFDEPMDVSIVEVVLAGSDALALTGSWDDDERSIEWLLPDLEYGSAYRIDLAGFRDVAGHALDGAPYLVDGILDFTTLAAPDIALPHAVSSDPPEGAVDPNPLRQVVSIAFSEAMDPALAEVPVRVGAEPAQPASGVWSADDTVLTLSFAEYLEPGVGVRVDVSGLTDVAGNLVDASHPYLVDGALDFALHAPYGDDCSDPLVASQADIGFGFHTWNIPASANAGVDGAFACAYGGAGRDAVIRYEKLSDTVANGGELLRVFAYNPVDGLDLEITSGDCDTATGVVEKCVVGQRSWTQLLDVPAGSYWIWLAGADPSAMEFPGAVVSVDEIPVSEAEGEGCFAPYDTSSATYTPPAMPGDAHAWTIPASMESFDVIASSGWFGCYVDPTYGAHIGADAVIAFQKANDDSVLVVEAESLASGFGPLAVTVLDGCDAGDPNTLAYPCGEGDELMFTSRPPSGTVYVWVSSATKNAPYPGADVRIAELAVTLGETRANPEPLTMSGPIVPTSMKSLEIPSCFPQGGNVHWYSYVVSGDLVAVKGDAAGHVGLILPTGYEAGCSSDTSTLAFGSRVTPGATVLIAVSSPTPIANLEIIDGSYGGVNGTASDLGITFPISAQGDGMALSAGQVFVGNDQEIWSFPQSGNATAVLHGSAEGLGDEQLGFDIAFAAGKLFSVDTTNSTSESRLWAVYDEASNVWGPTPWDVPGGYPPATRVRAMTHDGAAIILASRTTTPGAGVQLFALDPATPAAPLLLGENTSVYSVNGIAADATYFYVAGLDGSSSPGIYRIARADVAAPAQRVASTDSSAHVSVVVDDLAAAGHVYALDDSSIRVAVNPGSPTPIDLGPLPDTGYDGAMTIDRAAETLYVFDDFFDGRVLTVQ